MRTAEAIRAKLASAGVSGAGWPGYIGYVPDDGNQVIGIIPSGGYPQETHAGENLLETLQVIIRSAGYSTTDTKWLAMFNALQDVDLSADGIHLIQAMTTGPGHFLDSKNRHCMTASFRVVRSRV